MSAVAAAVLRRTPRADGGRAGATSADSVLHHGGFEEGTELLPINDGDMPLSPDAPARSRMW